MDKPTFVNEDEYEADDLWAIGYREGYKDAQREFKEYIKQLREDFEREGKI